MRANVLNDPALVKQAGQFAWLSIDSDKPVNENFTAKYATGGIPLFVVIDPETQKAVMQWYGTATAPQLIGLMTDGKRAIAGGLSGADAWLARADEANGQKNRAEAAKFYEQALQAGGPDWPRRTRTIESLIMALDFSRQPAECAETAVREAPGMKRDRSFVNAVYFGLECAKPGSAEMKEMEKLAEEGVKIPGVLGDDTSGLYQQLASTYRSEKNDEAATRVATAWLEWLRRQIAKAPTPEARMNYDLHLVSAANFLHKPELAVAEVERAERELPNDYNPPRMAAGLYSQMGRLDDAIAAADRAIAKAYGPLKLRLYYMKGQYLEKKGDREAAKKTYADGIAFGRTLPDAMAKAMLGTLEKAAASVDKSN